MQERRNNPQIREVFDHAYARIHCFFATDNTWANQPQMLLAHRQLQLDYPALTTLERQTLIDAAYRKYQEQRRLNTGQS